MKFALTDKDGSRTVYTLKPFDKLTLSDYGKFHCEPWPEGVEGYEHAIEYVSRMTGAPKKKLLRIPIKDFELLQAQAFDAIDKIKTAQGKEPGKTFTHKKQTFRVPHDLEDEPYQQWRALVDVYWPNMQREDQLHAAALACLCLKEGEDFDDVDVDKRMEFFMGLPCSIALGVCAFFFNRSKRYNESMSRSLNILQRSKLRSVAPTPMESTPISTAPSLG